MKRPDPQTRWPRLKHAADVYRLAAQGKTNSELGRELGLRPSNVTSNYREVLDAARAEHPGAKELAKERALIAQAGRANIDHEEVRRLAALGMPDNLIAIKIGVSVDTLVSHCRKLIDQARAELAMTLAEKIVAAAQGTVVALEQIISLLEKDLEGGNSVCEATLQDVIKMMTAEREKPNLQMAEKLLTRLGFYEAPLESELRIRVTFDEPARMGQESGAPAEAVDD